MEKTTPNRRFMMEKTTPKKEMKKFINISSTPKRDYIRVRVKDSHGKYILQPIADVPKTFWRDALQKRVDDLDAAISIVQRQANDAKQECSALIPSITYSEFDVTRQPQYEVEHEHIHLSATRGVSPYTNPDYLKCMSKAVKIEETLIPLANLARVAKRELDRYDNIENLENMDVGGYGLEHVGGLRVGKTFKRIITPITNFCDESCKSKLRAIKERIVIEDILQK